MKENNRNENLSSIKLDRGMTRQEVETLLTAPMPDRERAYFRIIYETFFRANELLSCDIENYNKQTGEITALNTKNKYSPKTKQHIKSPPKHASVSKSSQLLLKKIMGNRKKGAIFVNRKGKRLTKTYFQIYIYELATRLAIQKVKDIKPSGKKYHLVTLQGLREAGERHMDMEGADRDVTARGAQHSALVKEKHYKQSGWEEFQQQQKKYHPAFQEK